MIVDDSINYIMIEGKKYSKLIHMDEVLREKEPDLRTQLEIQIEKGEAILDDRAFPQASKRLLNTKVTTAKAVLKSPGPTNATLQSNIDILKEELTKFQK